jgi:hypothetical protein
VVADFMRQHIGLREVARRAEALAQFAVEVQVDIEVAVGRTVERAARGARRPAGRIDAPAEQRQRRLGIILPRCLEYLRPGLLRVGEHGGDEVAHFRVRARLRSWLGTGRRTRLGLRRRPGNDVAAAQEGQRIDAEQPGDHQDDEDRADPHAAAGPSDPATAQPAGQTAPKPTAETAEAAASAAPDIPDVRALPPPPPPHCRLLIRSRSKKKREPKMFRGWLALRSEGDPI